MSSGDSYLIENRGFDADDIDVFTRPSAGEQLR